MEIKHKTNFHGQDIPYDMYCNVTVVLNIDSVYKQGKNYHPQTYIQQRKYTNAEKQQCSVLSDDDNDGFFEVRKECVKDFCDMSWVIKTINK